MATDFGVRAIALVRDEMYRLAMGAEHDGDNHEVNTFYDAGDALADALDLLRKDEQ